MIQTKMIKQLICKIIGHAKQHIGWSGDYEVWQCPRCKAKFTEELGWNDDINDTKEDGR